MARFDASRRLPAAIVFTLVSACSGGRPAAPAPTPAAGHSTAGTAVRPEHALDHRAVVRVARHRDGTRRDRGVEIDEHHVP